MTSRQLHLHHLVGRQVHDVNGERVGRIHELCAEIELHEHGNDYVVREFHVGAVGWIEGLLGARFALMVARVLKRGGPAPHAIPWKLMDLTDPQHPRLSVTKASLR